MSGGYDTSWMARERGENYINTSMILPIMQWLIDATLSYNISNDYIIIAGSLWNNDIL